MRYRGALALLVFLAYTGCISRSMTIAVDDPVGTYQVYIDGKHRGPAPHTETFAFYGNHEVMLMDETGRITTVPLVCSRPWYEYFPLDFFPSVLYPAMIDKKLNFMLSPAQETPIDLAAIEKNAAAFRAAFEEAFPEDE